MRPDIKGWVPNGKDKPLPVSSSTAPDFPQIQLELFREVLTLMNARRIPYAVSGAFALRHHTGIWRDTKDLDLFLPAEHAEAALRYLKEDNFETEVCDPVWLAKAHRNGFFVDLITGMSNAVIIVDHSWIERADPAEILGVPSRVLGAEELLCSKLFVTRRERFDGADTVHVVYGTRGNLDWDRILHLVGDHWELLLWTIILYNYVYPANSAYVPYRIWNDLVERFRKQMENPNPSAQFRGSLIDHMMFAIDVDEWGFEDLAAGFRARRQNPIRAEGTNHTSSTEDAESEPAA